MSSQLLSAIETRDIERQKTKAIGFAFAIFLVLWLRHPDSLLNAQFWAEDGGLFFREQVLFGFWGALTRPYSGYIHIIPRIVAAVMCFLPVRWVPLGFNAAALVIESVSCGAFFWPCYRNIINSDWLRATCCLTATASIVAGSELIATLSNVQWYLCILSLLLVVTSYRTDKKTEIFLTVTQVCIALTAPITLLYIPFLLTQIKQKNGMLRIRPAIHVAALLLQASIMRHGVTGPRPVLQFNPLFLATISSGLSRCVLSPMLGSAFLTDDANVALFTKLVLALLLGTVLTTLIAIKFYGSPQMKWLLMAAYVGVGSLLAVLWGRGVVKYFLTMDGIRHYTAERYFFIGACMFIFCLALAIDSFVRKGPSYLAAVILGGAFTWGTIQNFSAKTFVDLNWPASAAKIVQWEERHTRHEPVESLSVPINPTGLPLVLDGNK